MEGDVHLGEEVVIRAEILAAAIAAESDYVRMFAEEQHVWDRAGFAGFDELTLECAGLGVGQEARVYLPADFFWVVHETVAISGGLPPISIASSAQARLPMLPKPPLQTFCIAR
jgi:hypothetical protein